MEVRVARFHNVFVPEETRRGRREKVLAAVCRKIAEVPNAGEIEIWRDGMQTRLYLEISKAPTRVFQQSTCNLQSPRF